MNIEFYFDPCCPFCWVTSRWLLLVSSERKLNITWQPFSLAIKNDELDGKNNTRSAGAHHSAHRVLRVMLAAQKQGAKLIDLYTDFGISNHIAGQALDNELIKDVLKRRNLPADLIKAADNNSYDKELKNYIDSATKIVGQDIGVPTIIFELRDGSKAGYFGPVLQDLPDKEESLKLWDALSELASSSSFYELKRNRPQGGPDVYSTAKC